MELRKVMNNVILPGIGFLGTVFGIFAFIYPTYVTQKIEISYFLVCLFVSIWIVAVLIIIISEKNRIIQNFSSETNFQLDLRPIQYNKENNILILKKLIKIDINTMVTIFIIQSDYEQSLALGYVHHIQDKAIQIKIIENENIQMLQDYFTNAKNLQTVIIRPFIRIDEMGKRG